MLKTVAIGVGALVVFVVVAFGVLRLTGYWDRLLPPGPSEPVDFATLEPGDKPNRYLACPPGLCERTTPNAVSPVYPVPTARLREAFRTVLDDQPSAVVEVDDADSMEIVQRTPLMRWPDRITVRFVELGPAESSLAIYSRSTYGYSDLGTNEKRVTDWLERLGQKLR